MNTTKVDYITQHMTSKLTNYLYTINIYVPERKRHKMAFQFCMYLMAHPILTS